MKLKVTHTYRNKNTGAECYISRIKGGIIFFRFKSHAHFEIPATEEKFREMYEEVENG